MSNFSSSNQSEHVELTVQQNEAWKLASWGFNVGPLNGKAAFTPRGVYGFTNDIDQVQRWWTQWPTANIGARVFKGHVVVDIDPRNGGADTWARLTDGHAVPATLTTLTGSGGRHYWFKLPRAGELRSKAGDGIDLQNEKKLLVMPGSVHPDTGRYYECEHWAAPALLPTWLEMHVYKPAPAPRSPVKYPAAQRGAGLINAAAGAQQGNRNEMLNWAAWKAAKEGLQIDDELLDAAMSIGLSETEARNTIQSARNGAERGAA